MDRYMDIDATVKAASKLLPSNPDYERYLQELLAHVSAEDRDALAQEGLTWRRASGATGHATRDAAGHRRRPPSRERSVERGFRSDPASAPAS
jgi:hypothetical protein